MSNIKKFKDFVNELNTSTYASIMNRTEDGKWGKNRQNPDVKKGDVNRLAIRRFIDEFYNEFPLDEIEILTNKGIYKFVFLAVKSTSSDYELRFEYADNGSNFEDDENFEADIPTRITIEAVNGGFNIDDDTVQINDAESAMLLKDMFKYHKINIA
jgi:hypothetical protein